MVRPENSHAYKRIRCADWEDAQTQAAAERAYLVTINDETEQKWLQAVFGGQPSWIGLNDIAEEGQWGMGQRGTTDLHELGTPGT